MTSALQLWMPIVLSAVLVFVASSLIHMVFKWHNGDYRSFANEDQVRDALRAAGASPGVYVTPHVTDMKEMGRPEVLKKFVDGPIAVVTLRPNGPPRMGPMLGQWFGFSAVVAALVAYVASKTLPVGAGFFSVCREVGVMTLLAYAGGSVIDGIWWGKPWGSVAKETLDAIIYGTLSALAFAWLWPAA
ncbi:MAG TPA: hypothetical protein VLT89_01975 [Usitatibacter sp.]|nr:hypothetical protein [Usitatibacter sp.]